MPRQRSPKRDLAYQLWLESKKKKKLKEIAQEIGVSEGQVRRWKNLDKWNDNVTNPKSNVTNQDLVIKTAAEEGIEKEDVEQLLENSALNEKQKLFCCYYIKSFNATKAYQKAYGCSYETAAAIGYRLLENVGVKDEIQRLKKSRLNRDFLTEEDIFQKYMDIAFADMTDYITFGTEEEPVIGQFGPVQVKNPDTGKKEQLMQTVNVIRLKKSEEVDGTLITEITQGRDGVRVKLADRMKALEWLTSHMDLGTPEQNAKLDKLRAETMRIKGEDPDEEAVDDGFLDALNGSAREDWSDEEED